MLGPHIFLNFDQNKREEKTMKTTTQRKVALTTLGVMAATTVGGMGLGTMGVAQASAKGKRNLALGLGAVTAYGLLKHNKTATIVGGLGTIYAYSKYKKE